MKFAVTPPVPPCVPFRALAAVGVVGVVAAPPPLADEDHRVRRARLPRLALPAGRYVPGREPACELDHLHGQLLVRHHVHLHVMCLLLHVCLLFFVFVCLFTCNCIVIMYICKYCCYLCYAHLHVMHQILPEGRRHGMPEADAAAAAADLLHLT